MSSYFDRLDWDKLKSFYVVAVNQSFTKASLQMNITQSALSRQINIIEYQLKSQLFIRGSDKLSLTSKGKILFDSVSKMLEEVKSAKSLIDEEDNIPQGKLTVATTHAFTNIWLLEHIPPFLKAYPKIDLSIIAQDNLDPLYNRHFDAFIGIFVPPQPQFIYEKIMSCETGMYTSLNYLKEFGTPKTVEELANHRLISFGDRIDHPYNMANWFLRIGCKKGEILRPFLEINSFFGMIDLAERGVGIISIVNNNPEIKKRGLVRVLPKVDGPVVNTIFSYSKSLENSKRVRVLSDFLKKRFANEKNPKKE